MPEPRQARILVVDDHAILRQGIRSLIENVPRLTVCAEAADGKEAIEKALEFKPDLVLMDINMPEMNGIEATKEIKHLLPSTTVMMLTLHDSPLFAEQAREAGAEQTLSKSSGLDVLVDAIASVLNGKEELRK